MIRDVPELGQGARAIEIGAKGVPDVLVSYAQPPTAMKIARAIEKASGESLKPVLSSVMAVCGNVAVGCMLSGDVTVSFGCADSREAGAIGRDRLIIGVPWGRVPELLGTLQ